MKNEQELDLATLSKDTLIAMVLGLQEQVETLEEDLDEAQHTYPDNYEEDACMDYEDARMDHQDTRTEYHEYMMDSGPDYHQNDAGEWMCG